MELHSIVELFSSASCTNTCTGEESRLNTMTMPIFSYTLELSLFPLCEILRFLRACRLYLVCLTTSSELTLYPLSGLGQCQNSGFCFDNHIQNLIQVKVI